MNDTAKIESGLTESVDGLPNLSGEEALIASTIEHAGAGPVYPLREGGDPFDGIQSACAVALHMHQPLIPAGGDDLRTATLISNLRYMEEHPDIGDNHNAPVFRWCYKRMGEFIPQLIAEGAQPRVMLEYSGTLLYGLREMGADDVIDALRSITVDPRYRDAVEWLGCPWGHAVAPSTPVQDYRLHVRAWQQYFAAMFGLEALGRVRGFSPSEMALPNHPDVAYEFVRTLRDCGYRWVLVQEHTVEESTGARYGTSTCPTVWCARIRAVRARASSRSSRRRAATPSWSGRCSPITRLAGSDALSLPAGASRRWSPRSPTARTAA